MEVMIKLSEQTVLEATTAALEKQMTFSAYVEWRLTKVDDTVAEDGVSSTATDTRIEDIARRLFLTALQEPVDEDESRSYLVEDLYKRNRIGEPWEQLSRGDRIKLGKAFKQVVLAQPSGGREIEGGWCVKVKGAGLTQQNQTKYRTVRSG